MKYYDASVKPKQFEENKEVLLFDLCKKRGQFAKWQVTWKGPFIVKKRLNDCNYVLQKSAKSRPIVVHVDQMRKYLREQDDSNAENADMPPLSDNSNVRERSLRSPGRMSKADTNANTPSEPAIAYQSEKSRKTAEPANSIMSTPTVRTPATATSATPAQEMDSIADTDTTDTAVSGTGQMDKPTRCSDISNS